jgi:hypothetical protein
MAAEAGSDEVWAARPMQTGTSPFFSSQSSKTQRASSTALPLHILHDCDIAEEVHILHELETHGTQLVAGAVVCVMLHGLMPTQVPEEEVLTQTEFRPIPLRY